MKKLVYLFIATLSVIFVSCTSTSKTEDHDVFILVDNTETIAESREEIIPTNAIIDLMKNGGKLTFQQVNAVSLNSNKSIEFSLPEDPTRFQKKQAIEPFVEKFEDMRKKFMGPVTKGTDNSSIYKPICNALKKLSESKASKKTLIIPSDMIENSRFGNFYRDQPWKKVKAQLDSAGVEMPEVNHLNIIILYDPLGDTKKEKQFERAMGYWAKIFEAADISYEVRPNL